MNIPQSLRCESQQNLNKVKLLYGPYCCNGIIKHRQQKLFGIIESLKSLNYSTEIVPTSQFNRLAVELNQKVILTCDIRNLKFNTGCKDDFLCKRIVDVIKEHMTYMTSEKNTARFAPICEGMRWAKGKHFLGSIKHHSSKSFDEFLTVPCNTTCTGEESQEIEFSFGSGDEYFGNFGTHSNIFKYICEEQINNESNDTVSASGDSSCACLSLDPPSSLSVCIRPPQSSPIASFKEEIFEYLEKTEQCETDINSDYEMSPVESLQLDEPNDEDYIELDHIEKSILFKKESEFNDESDESPKICKAFTGGTCGQK